MITIYKNKQVKLETIPMKIIPMKINEVRKISLSFADPLFPNETVKLNRTVRLCNGVIVGDTIDDLSIYNLLDQRYSEKIGIGWRCLSVSDQDISKTIKNPELFRQREKLTKSRNEAVVKMAKEVSSAIKEEMEK